MAKFVGCDCITCQLIHSKLTPVLEEIKASLGPKFLETPFETTCALHACCVHALMPTMSSVLDNEQFMRLSSTMTETIDYVLSDVVQQDGRVDELDRLADELDRFCRGERPVTN